MKRITRLIFFIVFLYLPALAFSQTDFVKGTVLDAHTREPIAFASVYLSLSNAGKITDSAGVFTMHLNSESPDTLNVSFVGYQLYRIPVRSIDFKKPF